MLTPPALIERFNREIEPKGTESMKVILVFLLWCGLFVLSWPIAALALFLAPIVWLLFLPLRLIGICFESVFALLRAVLFLPARILGHRS